MTRVPRKLKEAEKPKTLEGDLDRLRDYYGSCHHEREIRDEIVSAVEKLLDQYGLINVVKPEAWCGCGFCGAKVMTIVHRPWCVNSEEA